MQGTITLVADSEWSIRYSDGSANGYHFWRDPDGARFEYNPVTPERSSTGTYSGGKPRAGPLAAETVESLWQHVRALEGATALYVEDRGKGTGMFRITDDAGTRDFIVRRGAELAAFDAFVAELA